MEVHSLVYYGLLVSILELPVFEVILLQLFLFSLCVCVCVCVCSLSLSLLSSLSLHPWISVFSETKKVVSDKPQAECLSSGRLGSVVSHSLEAPFYFK